MSAVIGATLTKGQSIKDLATTLTRLQEGGRSLSVNLETRSVPYVTDTVAGWTDGPPSSNVAWMLSGADPHGHAWRRWTISRRGPGEYEIGCFPTPFKNALDPLAPGVPPTSSRVR